jgi:hypothetical protein
MKKKNLIWLGIGISAIAAAVAAVLLIKRKDEEEKPPKNAPQVPVTNPGDQSEFTTAASASDLG